MDSQTRSRIDAVLAAPEGRRLEFKEAANSFPRDKAIEYCVALANEGGGSLFLGVTDKRPRTVSGSNAFIDVEDTEHAIHEALNHRVTVVEHDYDGKRLLEIQINSRLSGSPLEYRGKYLMRQGESLVPMTPDALREVFAETRGHYLALPATEGLSPSEALNLLEVETFFRLLVRPMPSQETDAVHALTVEGLLTAAENGSVQITNMGAVLLAKDLRSFGNLQYHRIRFLMYSGNTNTEAVIDHFEYRGYGVAFEDIVARIQSHVPVNERINESLRRSIPLYPNVAIREFLANALIHQDFESPGSSVTVQMFKDRLEITNPGKPVIDVLRFVDETKSRNMMLSDLMRRMQICEIRGSGIDRVLNELEILQQPAPRFEARSTSTQITMRAHEQFDAMTLDERAWAAYLHCCLRWVSDDRLTNSSLRTRFGLPPAKSVQVSQAIARAVQRNLIRSDAAPNSGTKGARYVPFHA